MTTDRIPEETSHAVRHHSDDGARLDAALTHLTSSTTSQSYETHEGILAPAHLADSVQHPHSLSDYLSLAVSKVRDAAALYRWGNYVIDRSTGQRSFETMPLYVRLGMHMLYVGGFETAFLESASFAQRAFIRESVSMGAYFSTPDSRCKISGFVEEFNIDVTQLAEPNLDAYASFNAFFSRALKPDARPTSGDVDDTRLLSCAADSRCVVYDSISSATSLWIKGRQFTVTSLLGPSHVTLSPHYEGGQLAIFRLAPSDYHRWHSPVSGHVVSTVDIDGTLMTVNPMAINEDLNVFTENKRSVTLLATRHASTPVAVVAIGAMLVGSITWLCKPGDQVQRNDPQGYFEYGGSTVIVLFPTAMDVKFDDDLVQNSRDRVETIVKAGSSLGRVISTDL